MHSQRLNKVTPMSAICAQTCSANLQAVTNILTQYCLLFEQGCKQKSHIII